jgi:predicted DNA-binding transcriptional regulator YafY
MRTLPIHHSQTEVGPSEDGIGVVFSIRAVPNFEFYQTVAYNLHNIKILGPDSVKEEMKRRVKEILDFYE